MKPFSLTRLTLFLFATGLAAPFVSCGEDPDPASPTAGSGGSGGRGGTGGSPSAPDASPGPDARDVVSEIRCSVQADRNVAITPAAGRQVYCAIDLGSNNAKLQVLSMEPGSPLSFKDERQCRVALGFGNKVAANMKALPLAEIPTLVATMKEFERICTLDKGTLVGTEATQWARDATNIADVKAMVKTGTNLDIRVLTPDEEGIYGYVAGTRNAPEKFSLDPGSNSFQIGWWPKGAPAARTVSVPFGYQRAAAKHYEAETMNTYEVARTEHAADIKMQLEAALAALTPPTSLAMLKAAITAGNLKPEVFIVGQDGALHLSVRAVLRDAMGKWIEDKAAYDMRVGMERPMVNALFGDVTTIITLPELQGFFTTVIKDADFAALKSEKVRALYGEKALSNAVLVDTLVKEIGLTTIVLVPQEMPAGFILGNLP
jgi:hypothetical protein